MNQILMMYMIIWFNVFQATDPLIAHMYHLIFLIFKKAESGIQQK